MKKSKGIHRLLLVVTLLLAILTSGCQLSTQVQDQSQSQSQSQNKTDAQAQAKTEDTSDYTSFFDKSQIHSIDITIDEKDLQATYDAPLDETYYSATLNLDGTIVENVGFRTKGNSTLRQVADTESDRFSFKINTSTFVDDQKIAGLDEFVLNNMFSDASYLKEYLSYELMSNMGMNVPLCSYIEVSINGEAKGFYLLVESVDDSFLNRVFEENEGNLYRQDQGSDLSVDTTGLYKKSIQKNGDDESKTDIHQLTTALAAIENGDPGKIESILNVDSALSYIATNFILSSYDSYSSRMQQNYYLYNHNGLFYIIPWDYNMSFGGFPETPTGTLDTDSPVSGVAIETLPLINKLLSIEAYKERYEEILKAYMAELEGIESHIKELSDWIRPYVDADPTKFVTMAEFEAAIVYQENEVIKTISPRPTGTENSGERPIGAANMPPDGKRPNHGGMNGGGSGRSIINVIRETMTAVQEQLLQ